MSEWGAKREDRENHVRALLLLAKKDRSIPKPHVTAGRSKVEAFRTSIRGSEVLTEDDQKDAEEAFGTFQRSLSSPATDDHTAEQTAAPARRRDLRGKGFLKT